MLRTHTCRQLTSADIDQHLTLCGWVENHRDHGGTVFVDLRDRYGRTQIVYAPEGGQHIIEEGRRLRCEDVVQVTGKVAHRPDGTVNPKLDTGEIELRVTEHCVLNKCKQPPFLPTQADLPGEDLRLKYRYLDLRRPKMQDRSRKASMARSPSYHQREHQFRSKPLHEPIVATET